MLGSQTRGPSALRLFCYTYFKKADFFLAKTVAQKVGFEPRENIKLSVYQRNCLAVQCFAFGWSIQKGLNKDVRALWPSRALILGKAFEQPFKKHSTTQIVLTFSSFVEKDLNSTFDLFQNYLTSLTNQLTNYNCVGTGVLDRNTTQVVLRSLPLLDYCSHTKYFNFCACLHTPNHLSNAQKPSSLASRDAAFHEAVGDKPSLKQTDEGLRPLAPCFAHNDNNSIGLIASKHAHPLIITGVLRTLRLLNRPLKYLCVPQPTKLYTVIRSPHVFKKTREQFATTQYKHAIKLQFCSDVSFRIFLDSFVLLKLPAEVKMLIQSL